MTSSTKRKHVYTELLQSEMRVPNTGEEVVRVIAARGNNLHEVESATGETFLISMPSKFRKNVWIKRGDCVLVERIPEGDKVKAEIVLVLTKEHIRFLKNNSCWPTLFNNDKKETEDFRNHQPTYNCSSTSSSDEN